MADVLVWGADSTGQGYKVRVNTSGQLDIAPRAGERGIGTTNDHQLTRQTVLWSRVVATGTNVVSTQPAEFWGFLSNATTGGNISFFDAAASGTTATAFCIQPTNVNFVMPVGMRLNTGLAYSNTASGTTLDVTVLYTVMASG